MDTAKDVHKSVSEHLWHRARETRQRSEHICDEARLTQETAQNLLQECQKIIDQIFCCRLLTFFALVTSCVVEVS
jgi:hypothetical protein